LCVAIVDVECVHCAFSRLRTKPGCARRTGKSARSHTIKIYSSSNSISESAAPAGTIG
jgi:hypothetical protein